MYSDLPTLGFEMIVMIAGHGRQGVTERSNRFKAKNTNKTQKKNMRKFKNMRWSKG